MKNFRLSFVLVMLALVLAIVPAVFAQDTLGASQADFDLWTAANTTSSAFKTVSFNFTVALDASGMGDSNTTANLTGTGLLSSDQANPQFQLDVTGTIVEAKKTQPVNVGVRVVGDTIYYNDGTSGWKGRPLADVMSSVTGELGSLTGGAAGSGTAGSGDLSGLSSLSGLTDAMSALEGLKPSDFLMLTRVDEGGQAHFTLSLDIAKLLSSPALAPIFSSLNSLGSTGSGTSTQMTDAQMQQVQAMFSAMFSKATIAFDEYVDPTSSLVQRAALNINLPLDGIVGPGAALKLSFDISLSNYNAPITVEAPAGAVMETSSN